MPAPKTSLSDRLRQSGNSLIHFLTSALFINNLLVLLGTGLFLLLFVMWWLRCYTHHGQKIIVENYVDAFYEDAKKDAKSKDFILVVEDSIFIVGQPGGMIKSQNPLPGAEVKEGRRLYVTITKYTADQIPLTSLPTLYGKEVNGVRKALKQRFSIESEIVSEVFDDGPPNVILAVILDGDTIVDRQRKMENGSISKGAVLQLVVSKDISESVPLPDLVCQTLTQADFIINASRLVWGSFHLDDNVTNRFGAWIYKQEPPFASGAILSKGDTISVWLTQARPYHCPEENDTTFD